MSTETPRIVYMGTPDFAVAPLKLLLERNYRIEGVITASDRPAGRGKRVTMPSVKQFIQHHSPSIPVLQPPKLKDPGFLQELEQLQPDLQVVVAFRMLPEAVWALPRLGTFNLHASLLPQYRGAAPIHHAVMNGEKETGVTTFLIDEKIDTGNILLQERTPIGEFETTGELHDRLMEMGAELVARTVDGLSLGELQPRPQHEFMEPGTDLKTAPKISREDCRIDWKRQGEDVFNMIRGLSPFPGAFSYLQRTQEESLLCKIFDSRFIPGKPRGIPGTLFTDNRRSLEVAVSDGHMEILRIQQEGKRRMNTADFLAGFSLISGTSRFS